MLETKYNGKYLNFFDTNDHICGRSASYEFVSRKTTPYRQGNLDPDCVTVIARHITYDTGNRPIVKLAVIHNFRPVINEWVWELPAGKIDDGETVEQAAKRELKEETGLDLTKIIYVRENVFSSVGMTDEQHAIVICNCEGELSTEYLDEGEEIKPYLYDKYQINHLFTIHQPIAATLLLTLMQNWWTIT